MGVAKIYDQTITIDSTGTSVSGLDGDADEEYLLEFIGASSADGVSRLIAVPNGVDQSIRFDRHYHDTAGYHGRFSEVLAGFLLGTNFGDKKNEMLFNFFKLYAKSGIARICTGEDAGRASGYAEVNQYQTASIWTDTTTNITSLLFKSTSAVSYTGRLIIWRVTP